MNVKTKVFKVMEKWAAAVKVDLGEETMICIQGPFDTEAEANEWVEGDECAHKTAKAVAMHIAETCFSEIAAEESAKKAIDKARDGATLQ